MEIEVGLYDMRSALRLTNEPAPDGITAMLHMYESRSLGQVGEQIIPVMIQVSDGVPFGTVMGWLLERLSGAPAKMFRMSLEVKDSRADGSTRDVKLQISWGPEKSPEGKA
jgi:hypothetical protein